MPHVELRPLQDDDLDAMYEMLIREPAAAAALPGVTVEEPLDRSVFDASIAAERASDDIDSFAVTENGAFVGTAGTFTFEDDREVVFWIARAARGRGLATQALRMLVSREPIRPLYARVAADNAAAIAVLQRIGFAEVSREPAAPATRHTGELLYALLPVLDGI
ncbi:GNAT family N-acetyltransferase [Microbacterium sp. zg.Y909]|uniref:GNAT family N-acetyltransferase n=1 Tax=Microbacterium sp. zg.Y909 TaxID=2969413 RepID=UPI00214BB3BA|nr:GNAT family N-acetyltransferase [Microbacterium sp. zg.Y909]MCR2824565.1 GNAT family N-acetyltransferase [Microbacterium sp. zg.Y909]